MANEISDERMEEIHTEYYNAKTKMRDVIHRIAVVYFSRPNSQNARIERTIGSILQWSNSDWESIEDRTPNQMVAKPIIMKVLLENLLKDMVEFYCLTQEHAKELLA